MYDFKDIDKIFKNAAESLSGTVQSIKGDKSMTNDIRVDVLRVLLARNGALIDEEAIENTPTRWLKGIRHFCQPYNPKKDLKVTFTDPSNNIYDHGIIVQVDIPYRALCAHHLFPVLGVAHVGYIPVRKVVGLSKLARLVYGISHRTPSLQEHVGAEIVRVLEIELECLGAMAIISAEHGCMACRGVEEPNVATVTSHVRGVFMEKAEVRKEFLNLIQIKNR